MNILIWQVNGCVKHLIFLHNLRQLQQPCSSKEQEHPSSSSSRFNFVFVATSSSLHDFIITTKHFCTDGIFDGSKEMETSGNKIWGVRWVGQQSLSSFCDFFLCFQTCVWSCVELMENFSRIF